MKNEVMRYQALDGLRAVAILFVLLSHARGSPGAPEYPQWWWHLGDLGNLGVRIFFVLSGFIITHILLRESNRQNRIDIRAFYVRRVFRIIPPLLALMGIVMLGVKLGYWQVPLRQFLMALAFLGNYVGESGRWTLGHLWSLAVEEQFYLLWPAVLAFTIRRTGPRMLFIFAGLVFAPLMRVFGPAHGVDDPVGFIENSDSLAMGALVAILFAAKAPGRVRQIMESIPAFLSGMMIVLLNFEPIPTVIRMTVCYPLIHLCVAALILRLIQVRNDPGTKILSTPPFVFVGVISYSLYLFQQLAFNRPPPAALPGFPGNLLLAFALATISHFCIERPAARWRDRFLHRRMRADGIVC